MTDRSAPAYSVRLVHPPSPPKPTPKTPEVRAAEEALRQHNIKMQEILIAVAAGVFSADGPTMTEAKAKQDRLYAALRAAQAKAKAQNPPPDPPPPDEDLSLKVLSFEFEESEKKADQLTLTVDNRDLTAFDNPAFATGNKLIVAWGYAGNMTPVREMVIRSVKGGLTLKVVAQSKAVLMNRDVKSRVFENKKRSDIVRQIAKENGYGADVQHIEDSKVSQAHIAQARLTDAQFMKRLADIEGFEFYVDHEGLHWKPRNLGKKPMRVLQYMLPPDVGDIITFDVENDLTAKPGAITVTGRDPLKKEDIKATADNSSTPRTTLAAVVEVVDPRTGATERRPNNASEDTRPSSAKTAEDAKREADGAYKRTQLAAVQLTATIVGDPRFLAKNIVEVRGLGQRLSGKYYVQETKHKIDSSGYLISFKAKSDGGNKRAGPKATTAAAQNKQEPQKPGGTERVEVVNPQTGATTQQWRPT